jgi:hypothetical protein
MLYTQWCTCTHSGKFTPNRIGWSSINNKNLPVTPTTFHINYLTCSAPNQSTYIPTTTWPRTTSIQVCIIHPIPHTKCVIHAYSTNIIQNQEIYTTGIIFIGQTTFAIIKSTSPILYQPTHLAAEAYGCQTLAKYFQNLLESIHNV